MQAGQRGGAMNQFERAAIAVIWPDVSTPRGVFWALSLGTGTLMVISMNYFSSLLDILSKQNVFDFFGENAVAELAALPWWSVTAYSWGIVAIVYLASRIWNWQCLIAASVTFLWLGYELVDAVLGITAENAVVSALFLYGAFQGVRACASSAQPAD
jgi:hypothetical protein